MFGSPIYSSRLLSPSLSCTCPSRSRPCCPHSQHLKKNYHKKGKKTTSINQTSGKKTSMKRQNHDFPSKVSKKKLLGESTAATISTNRSFVLPFAEQTLRDFHMPGIAGLTGFSAAKTTQIKDTSLVGPCPKRERPKWTYVSAESKSLIT